MPVSIVRHIYLDNHATTALDERVFDAMLPYLKGSYGNPSSNHALGWQAEKAVKRARLQVASLLGATSPREIVFTSGATESNNLALRGVMEASRREGFKGQHVIVSAIEHPSVLACCAELERAGASVTRVGVDSLGLVSLDEVHAAIQPQTQLISLMAVNNEVGTIQPIREIGEMARDHGVLFHCDASQAAGRIDLNVERDNIDLLSLSAHKMYGPKGVGALYVRRRRPHRVEVQPQQYGGGQEGGIRSGTVNVPGVVGLGVASEIAEGSRIQECERMVALRKLFLDELRSANVPLRIRGSLQHRVPGNLSLGFEGVSGETLQAYLPHLAFSIGSACSNITAKPSHVLQAMGLSREEIRNTIRLGFGRFNSRDEVRVAARDIAAAIKRLPLANQARNRVGSSTMRSARRA
jgi:cysteine desulfurase